jgi:hypothetical protein
MMLPIAAPARMPAPTAQPTHSAFAGAGAIMAATPMPAAPITAMRDLCMCSFSETTQVTTTEDSTRLYSKGYRTVYSAMKLALSSSGSLAMFTAIRRASSRGGRRCPSGMILQLGPSLRRWAFFTRKVDLIF